MSSRRDNGRDEEWGDQFEKRGERQRSTPPKKDHDTDDDYNSGEYGNDATDEVEHYDGDEDDFYD